jgi:hypothetical protein
MGNQYGEDDDWKETVVGREEQRREAEGSGAEPGLQENSGLQDEKAAEGEDTAAAAQDEATEPRHAG